MPTNEIYSSKQSPRTLGRYTLVREIARSNDVVWEARDPQMHRKVAVKELALPPTLAGHARVERIERFYREARAAGAMSHPNIVTIYEIGEEQGRYFIAMEFLEGTTLRERLSVGGALPLSEAIGIAGALCQALAYAHAQGVIHRDIKPDNVHLLPGGGVKLTDFGIARITHEDALTVDGQVFGTPSYMSPEQVVGRQIDARSDIFSLGIVLFEMLSGKKPFTGDSVVTITYQIMNADMPSLPAFPMPLEEVLRRALAKHPTDRFARAEELQDALEAAVRGDALPSDCPRDASPAALPTPAETVLEPTVAWQQTVVLMPVGGTPEPEPTAPQPRVPFVPPRPARRARTLPILLALLLLAAGAGAGAWAVLRITATHDGARASPNDFADYQTAVFLYAAGRYEEAAPRFQRLSRHSGDVEVRAKANLRLLYCYRRLGRDALQRGDATTAARWYRMAVDAAPGDLRARQGLNDALRAAGAPSPAR